MKNDVLIIYGSLNSVPSPEGAAPAKVIYETVKTLNDKRFKVLSNHNPKLNSFSYNKEVFLHVKPNAIDKLVLLGLKLMYPYKKRKQKFSTTSDSQLLFFITVCRFILLKGYKKIIVHVSVGLVNMIKLLLPNREVVFYHHGTSLHTKYNEEQWQELISNTKAIFGVNNIALEKANSTFENQLTPKKYIAIPNAIISQISLDQVKDYYNKRTHNTNSFVFAFSGRICIEKGVLQLLEAFEKVFMQNKNVQLMIFGAAGTRATHDIKTDYLKQCLAFAETRDLPIHFAGFLNNDSLLKSLSEIDAVILPTDNKRSEEGMPLCLIEAISLGKPIIATNSGGNSEVVKHDKNGILITSNPYIDELESAMLKMSTDEDLYLKFSKAAYTSYIENHTYESYNKTFIKALKAINFIDE